MRVLLSPFVPGDLEKIADSIALASPRQARRLLRLLRARMKEFAGEPQFYRHWPELGSDARFASVGEHVILFRIRPDAVRIERVVRGGWELLPILKKAGP